MLQVRMLMNQDLQDSLEFLFMQHRSSFKGFVSRAVLRVYLFFCCKSGF
jgi:hypothetical protein